MPDDKPTSDPWALLERISDAFYDVDWYEGPNELGDAINEARELLRARKMEASEERHSKERADGH